MPFANPRRRRHHHRKNRHRHHARRNFPPILMNRHRRRRNPGTLTGATSLIRHPKNLLMGGTVGAIAAFGSLAFPNSFFPQTGTDITSRVIRIASRAAAGGLLYMLVRKTFPRYAENALMGATIAVGGGAVLELLGISLVVGKGDTVLLPGQLVPGFSNLTKLLTPATTTVAGYTRPMGALAYPQHGTLGAYTPRHVAFRGIHGSGSFGLTPFGDRLYG